MRTGVIGMGNMAGAILSGILKQGLIKQEDIIASCKTSESALRKEEELGIKVCTDNRMVAQEANLLILAVKPQFLEEVLLEIREDISEECLILSIIAGKSISFMEKILGKDRKIIRVMPNTPAMVLEGCSAYCENSGVSPEELQKVEELLQSFGKSVHMEERLMDAFGAVAGSSPAYVFMMMEAMADAAVAAGIPRAQAYEIVGQAVLGSAKLMLETNTHPAVLKDAVCSPGGTTIRGLKVLEKGGFRGMIMEALQACVEQSRKL